MTQDLDFIPTYGDCQKPNQFSCRPQHVLSFSGRDMSSDDNNIQRGAEDEDEDDVKIGLAQVSSSDDDDDDDDDSQDKRRLYRRSKSVPMRLYREQQKQPQAFASSWRDVTLAENSEISKQESQLLDHGIDVPCDHQAAETIHEVEDNNVPTDHHEHAVDMEEVNRVEVLETPVPSAFPSVIRKANARFNSEKDRGDVGNGQRAPGAVHVRGRAPGLRASLFLQIIRRENQRRAQELQQQPPPATTDPEAAVTVSNANGSELQESVTSENDYNSKGRNRRTVFSYSAATLCLIIGVAIAVGVGVTAGTKDKSHSNKASYKTSFAPFSNNCSNLMSELNPNILSQCRCNGRITSLAKDVHSQYSALAETFIPTVFPDFLELSDSCHPRNQALLWLASGDGITTETVDSRQRYLLALLFILWNGPSWSIKTGWLSATDECIWKGISCNANHQVVTMDLSSSNLVGDLGSDFTLITSLISLSLDQNHLQGTLPTELVQLLELEEFTLGFNALSGTIPTEYGRMSQLTQLWINDNEVSGSLPTEFGLLTSLELLRLSSNVIEGTIPTEFGNLDSIQSISLDNNHLSGELPTEMGKWRNAQLIDFSVNDFSGSTIPSEIGMISTLTKLVVLGGGLNGTLPEELFGILGLQEIAFTTNHLNGTISTLIGQLSTLTGFYFDGNRLTGTIPNEIGNCTNLSTFLVNKNLLNGTVPSSIGLLNLNKFDIRGNPFTGSISKEICAVSAPWFCVKPYSSTLQCDCCNCPGGAFEDSGR